LRSGGGGGGTKRNDKMGKCSVWGLKHTV